MLLVGFFDATANNFKVASFIASGRYIVVYEKVGIAAFNTFNADALYSSQSSKLNQE